MLKQRDKILRVFINLEKINNILAAWEGREWGEKKLQCPSKYLLFWVTKGGRPTVHMRYNHFIKVIYDVYLVMLPFCQQHLKSQQHKSALCRTLTCQYLLTSSL